MGKHWASASLLMLVLTPWAGANFMPRSEDWAAGRLVPARSVAVDVVSEDLKATVAWHPVDQDHKTTKDDGSLYISTDPPPGDFDNCDARVRVEYVLRADEDQVIPVIFPMLFAPAKVTMRANGQVLKVHIVGVEEVMAAYQAEWKQLVDAAVAADPVLAHLRDEEQAEMAFARREYEAAKRAHPDDKFLSMPDAGGIAEAFVPDVERQLRLRGRQGNVKWMAVGLAAYLAGGKDLLKPREGIPPATDPDDLSYGRYLRMIGADLLRAAALALDPAAPDPFAVLAEQGEEWGIHSGAPMSQTGPKVLALAVTELPLRRGENRVVVDYTDHVGFGLRGFEVPKPDGVDRGLFVGGDFSYILRTARFWRSFGHLRVEVVLPEQAKWAACSLPGARVESKGKGKVVIWEGDALPPVDLDVWFSNQPPVSFGEDEEKEPSPPAGASRWEFLDTPSITLVPKWRVRLGHAGHGLVSRAMVADRGEIAAGVESRVILLKAATGSTVWDVSLGPAGEGRRVTSSPPLWDGLALTERDVLVAEEKPLHPRSQKDHTMVPGVVCLDRATGRSRWETWFGTTPKASCFIGVRTLGDVVVVMAGLMGSKSDSDRVYAVELATGKVLWSRDMRAEGACRGPEGRVYLAGRRPRAKPKPNEHGAAEKTTTVGLMMCVKATDGAEVWRVERGESMSAPALSDGKLYLTGVLKRDTGEGGPPKPDTYLGCFDAADGKAVWLDSAGPSGTPLVVGHRLYLPDAGPRAYDLDRDHRLAWFVTLGVGVPGAANADALYVYGAKFDLATGKPLWVDSVGLGAPTVVADGLLVSMGFSTPVTITAYSEPTANQIATAKTYGVTHAERFLLNRPRTVGKVPDDLADRLLRTPAAGAK